MLRWVLRTGVIFVVILAVVYGCVYGADYLTYEDWQPEFSTLNGDPLVRPTDVSEKTFVFVMWTTPGCQYCVAQIRAIYELTAIEGIPDEDFDVVLVWQEAPTGADSKVLNVIGPPKVGYPYTQFWVNREDVGWVVIIEWAGLRDPGEMQELFMEAIDEQET